MDVDRMYTQDETRPLFFESNRSKHSIEMTLWDPTVCSRECAFPYTFTLQKETAEEERNGGATTSESGHCPESADI